MGECPVTDWYARAACIPGRSSTRSKAPGKMFDVGAGPMYASYAHDALIVDDGGRSLIDMLCALGAVSLGYAHRRPALGVLSLPHIEEVMAAEAVLSTVAPWATQVRFTRTGSEALSAARMVAQAATGRNAVLVADNSYHGWHPWTAWRGHTGTDGEHTLTYRYGDMDSVVAACIGPHDFAAIFVEPARWEQTPDGFLLALAEYARRIGALLVMDEMIYGGRAALGGMTELAGLKPDLACYGKAIGNGAPVACVVGNGALLLDGELVSGTYGGDVGAADAVEATLAAYQARDVIGVLHLRGKQLRRGLETVLAGSGWAGRAHVEGAIAPHLRLRFDDPTVGRRFAAGMAARGVLWHPEVCNVCAAHTEKQIDTVVAAAEAVLAALEING